MQIGRSCSLIKGVGKRESGGKSAVGIYQAGDVSFFIRGMNGHITNQAYNAEAKEIEMPKYLVEANYVGEGINGLLKEGGSGRRAAVDELFKSMNGTVEAFYYAFGDTDVFIIGELPDNTSAAALALRVNASGAAMCKTTVLMTATEIDAAVKKTATYRPPGYELQAEEAKWDSEGGHLPKE
jgi:uncharacterized protein with GYD domain